MEESNGKGRGKEKEGKKRNLLVRIESLMIPEAGVMPWWPSVRFSALGSMELVQVGVVELLELVRGIF